MNTSKASMPIVDSKEGRDFEKLVKWTSAFSIAVIAGALASLRQINPTIELRFSVLSVVAFIAGGVATLLFIRAFLGGNKRRRAVLLISAAFVSVPGFFLFGIKNASPDSRRDVTIGTVIALVVLSFLGWVLWQMSRFLEADDLRNGSAEK